MLKYDVPFILLIISALLIFMMFVYIVRMKNKAQIHYAFLSIITLIFIWCIGHILEVYTTIKFGYTMMIFVYIYYFGLCFVPVSLLFTGLIFVHTKLNYSFKYVCLFIFPIVDYLVLLTNDYHKLYFIRYSIFNHLNIFGSFFAIHTIFSYAYIVSGVFFLVRFSFKNSGFFSNQSILILIGLLGPFGVNILQTLSIIIVPVYLTPVSFSFAVICFAFAIFKFNFLNIVPIALQRIVDLISDSYLIIDKDYFIIDYNKTFINSFKDIIKINRKDSLLEIFKSTSIDIDGEKIIKLNNEAIETKKTLSFEKQIEDEKFNKYYKIEITPIFSSRYYLGTIILLKDITQAKLDLETIKENQAILIEQERLASLGQLIGGIAHNIRTPIMSISGAIEALKDLAYEYRDSIDDKSVTEQDHKEIAKEMLTWLEKMRPYCAYMSDVISAVKGQAVQMNASTMTKFTVDELVKRVELLMRHELKKNHIILTVNSEIDMNTEIKGEVSNLIQVFDNIIINAVHAYEGKEGTIELKILRSGDNIEFVFTDNAKGIPKEITDRLFREMVTTKGKNGTGLGLYMSYATVKGRFGGNISFTSKQGNGTTFYISIPCISYNQKEVG